MSSVAHRRYVDVTGSGSGYLYALSVKCQQQSFDTCREAQRRHSVAAQILYKSVISAAAADRALRADIAGDEFKYRLCIIVKTAYNSRIDRIFYAAGVKIRLNAVKVLSALVAQVVEYRRSALRDLVIVRHLAVEQAHRVAPEPVLAVVAQLVLISAEVFGQSLVIIRPALGAADRVDLKSDVLQSQAVKDISRRGYQLGVSRGILCAVALHTELVELSESARLRLLIAVAGGQVVRLDRQRIVVQTVLEKSPRRASCALGTERYAVAALGDEGVHLLLHYVGGVADSALKEIGVLKDRRAHLLIAEGSRLIAEDVLEELPAVAVARQHILGALGLFGYQCHIYQNLSLVVVTICRGAPWCSRVPQGHSHDTRVMRQSPPTCGEGYFSLYRVYHKFSPLSIAERRFILSI